MGLDSDAAVAAKTRDIAQAVIIKQLTPEKAAKALEDEVAKSK